MLVLAVASELVEEKMVEVVYAFPFLSTVVNTETNDSTTQVAFAEVKVKAMVLGAAEGSSEPVAISVPRFMLRLFKFILTIHSERKRRCLRRRKSSRDHSRSTSVGAHGRW